MCREQQHQQGQNNEGFRIELAGPLTPQQVLRFHRMQQSAPAA